MPYTNLIPLLADARKHRYALPAFDVSNDEMIRAVAEVCEEERSPAIFMLLKADLTGLMQKMLIDAIRAAAAQITVPVCIHLDHATHMDDIVSGIEAGVTSVMYDGSMLPFEENVRNSRSVVEYAHARGVSVEAELGHVADAIGGTSETMRADANAAEAESMLTNPQDVKRFVAETGVDCLAVAIGTAHGVYVSTPTLRLERLREIEAASPCPLVLHGGSGTPDDAVQQAISLGITKINIYSEVLSAMNQSLKEKLNSIENLSIWPSVLWKPVREEMRRVIRHKIRTFGAEGRVRA